MYINEYNNIHQKPFVESFKLQGQASDPGFVLLQKFLSGLNFNSRWFLTIVSALTFVFWYKALKNSSNLNHLIFWLIYLTSPYFVAQFTTIRHELGTSLLFYAFSIKSKSKMQDLLKMILYGIASSIHISILLVLPFFILVRQNSLGSSLILLSYCLFLYLIFKNKYFEFERLSGLHDPSNLDSIPRNLFSLIHLKIILSLIFIIIIFNKNQFENYYFLFLKLFIFGLIIRLFLIQFGILGSRLGNILGHSEIFLLTSCFSKIKNPTKIILVSFYLLINSAVLYKVIDESVVQKYFNLDE